MVNVDIEAMMVVKGHDDVALEEDDGIYEKGDEFKSFHCQANHPMSRQALPTGFLSVWLKCVVSSLLHDRILPTTLFPAVQLVYGRALILLPATVCCIQHGLQSSDADGGVLQGSDSQEDEKRTRPSS